VLFSKDGRILVIGHHDGHVRFWDFQRPALLAEYGGDTNSNSKVVFSLSYSNDGEWLAAVSIGRALVVNTRNPKQPRALPVRIGNSGGTTRAAFPPDGKSIVTMGHDGRVRFWSLATFKEALTLRHSDGPWGTFEFADRGNLLVTVDGHGTLKFWPARPTSEIPNMSDDLHSNGL